jgi:hypothetical protein
MGELVFKGDTLVLAALAGAMIVLSPAGAD